MRSALRSAWGGICVEGRPLLDDDKLSDDPSANSDSLRAISDADKENLGVHLPLLSLNTRTNHDRIERHYRALKAQRSPQGA